MEDIKEVLEMLDPADHNVLYGLKDSEYYMAILKGVKRTKTEYGREETLLNLYFQRYSTVPPKFINRLTQQRFTVQDVKYIFKLKKK